MSLIPFPDVPSVPGVPAVFRSLTVPTPGAVLNSALGGLTDAIFGPVVWGVFDKDGNQALTPDSFLGVEYRNESRVSNYPQEQGAFASYNKVATPFDCRVRMAIGGDKASRTAFLSAVDAMLKGIDLFTVVTPEVTYANATLETYDYRRDSFNGVSMLIVSLDFIEVRITATAQFSAASTKSPSGADPVSGGQAQTFPVSQSVVVGTPL